MYSRIDLILLESNFSLPEEIKIVSSINFLIKENP